MNNILIAVGPFFFYTTAPSFNMLRTTLEPRWSEQERVSRAPASQWIGPAAVTIDVNGTLYPDSFVEQQVGTSSSTMMDDMRDAANAGNVYSVVSMIPYDNSGFALGLWYIRSVQNERTWFDDAGAKRIDFQITLRSYGDDAIQNAVGTNAT